MKKALIGLANNITPNLHKIKCWSASFKKYSSGDIFLLCANATEEELKECGKFGINVIPVSIAPEDLGYVNHKRLLHTNNFLKMSDIDLCIITDVYDVIFQNDPFLRLDLESFDIFLGAEGVALHQEPWNFDTVARNFPEHLESSLSTPIVCSGIIAGKRLSLISLYERMFELCENCTKSHNIMDQAALIVMLAKNEIPKLKIFNLNDHWAVHCAVAGPTNLFEGWGFKNQLISQNLDIPYLEDNLIKSAGQTFDMIHQFNRIPEWNSAVTGIYLN